MKRVLVGRLEDGNVWGRLRLHAVEVLTRSGRVTDGFVDLSAVLVFVAEIRDHRRTRRLHVVVDRG